MTEKNFRHIVNRISVNRMTLAPTMCFGGFSGEPDAPQNVQISDVTRKSLIMHWSPPDDDGGSKVKGYYIEKRTQYSPRWSRVNKVLIKDNEYMATDLKDGDEYEFRVMAYNEAGVGKPSTTTPPTRARDPFGQLHFSTISIPFYFRKVIWSISFDMQLIMVYTTFTTPYPCIILSQHFSFFFNLHLECVSKNSYI